MMQEAKSTCAGQWYLPAGRMEPGEDIAEAAQREVLEETGLHFQITTLLMVESAGKALLFRSNRVLSKFEFNAVLALINFIFNCRKESATPLEKTFQGGSGVVQVISKFFSTKVLKNNKSTDLEAGVWPAFCK